ncbi:MAG TPA: hypothetical protein VIC87_06350, partial [Vicinamibacteria bacterium]
DLSVARGLRGLISSELGRHAEATTDLKWVVDRGTPAVSRAAALGYVYARAGRVKKARESMRG